MKAGKIILIIFGIILFLALIAAILYFGYFREAIERAREAENEIPVYAVNIIPASRGQIRDYISLSGDIFAGATIDVYAEVQYGRIAEIYVNVGSRVNRGTAIAAIDPSRPGMTYRNSIATSPINGTITAIPVTIGMTISQAVPLARISGDGGLEIRLNIAERFISKMALNLPCEITLDAWPGEIFHGSISEISPTVDMASRTMEVRVNAANTDSKLKPGMFAKVKIITEQKENIVKIPASAVLRRYGEEYVYIVEQDAENPKFVIAVRRNITQGIVIDGIAEITSGLSPGDEVVTRGQTLLDDGARVNVIERAAPLGTVE